MVRIYPNGPTGGRNLISATLLFDLDGHSKECLFPPCWTNGAVCESRIGAQVYEANMMSELKSI